MASKKISDIEGIGPVYQAKLNEAGVSTTDELLNKGADSKGRKELAAKTGLETSQILKWVNMADLYRVKGIGSEYAELLEKSGVDTVKELRNRNAANLHAKMEEVNSSGKASVRALPGLKQVEGWIENAKTLEPKVSY